jgi:hypothetical protein
VAHEPEDSSLPQARVGAGSRQRRDELPSERTPRMRRGAPAMAMSNPRAPKNDSSVLTR